MHPSARLWAGGRRPRPLVVAMALVWRRMSRYSARERWRTQLRRWFKLRSGSITLFSTSIFSASFGYRVRELVENNIVI